MNIISWNISNKYFFEDFNIPLMRKFERICDQIELHIGHIFCFQEVQIDWIPLLFKFFKKKNYDFFYYGVNIIAIACPGAEYNFTFHQLAAPKTLWNFYAAAPGASYIYYESAAGIIINAIISANTEITEFMTAIDALYKNSCKKYEKNDITAILCVSGTFEINSKEFLAISKVFKYQKSGSTIRNYYKSSGSLIFKDCIMDFIFYINAEPRNEYKKTVSLLPNTDNPSEHLKLNFNF
jgi:hypothetical protein